LLSLHPTTLNDFATAANLYIPFCSDLKHAVASWVALAAPPVSPAVLIVADVFAVHLQRASHSTFRKAVAVA
jgi:hypothetical protein